LEGRAGVRIAEVGRWGMGQGLTGARCCYVGGCSTWHRTAHTCHFSI
jgi:hypothetical protein